MHKLVVLALNAFLFGAAFAASQSSTYRDAQGRNAETARIDGNKTDNLYGRQYAIPGFSGPSIGSRYDGFVWL